MKKKKLCATALALCFASPMALAIAGCGETVENKVITGSVTDLTGEFRYTAFLGSSIGAADKSIQTMTDGYATMEMDKYGDYQWNATSVKSHSAKEVTDADGNTDYEVTIEINQGLKLSDGTEVTADNYLAYILAFASAVGKAAGEEAEVGMSFAGYADYKAYTGEDGTGSKVFSGIRKLSDYSFSVTIDGPTYYPYYFAYTYGAVSCFDTKLILGDDVTIQDDGNGCYLSDNWYEKSGGTYTQIERIQAARFDTSTYAYSGPYTVSEWDSGTKTATLKLNPNYAGNFEGQKPSIETIVYTKVIEETMFDQLSSGAIDTLEGLTGGDQVNKGLALVNGGGFSETHYDRAGYGKVEFDCDFGPTMFKEVRQAISYLLNKQEFASNFTGGYGSLVYGPYSRNLEVYTTAGGSDFEETLNKYEFSTAQAAKVLEDGGWIYNADGSAYSGSGVRYKKLTADEATDENIAYKGVTSEGSSYSTVKVGDDYYMPLVINWFCSENNSVSDMLTTVFIDNENITGAGMLITKTQGTFTKLLGEVYRKAEYGYGGTPTYGMYNLATNFGSAVYDYSYNWSLDPNYFAYSADKLYDEYDVAFPYSENSGLTYDEAYEKSGGKLGMDYLSMAMVYSVEPEDKEEYAKWWAAYITRWNELSPEIPLYSNIYYDVYNSKIKGMETTPYRGVCESLLYCTVG